jgi:hypothetical protein
VHEPERGRDEVRGRRVRADGRGRDLRERESKVSGARWVR